MPSRPDRASMPHLASLLAAFLAVSVLMGVLAAGIFLPSVWAIGSGTSKTVKAFDAIPDDFQPGVLSQQSRILDASGKVIATPYDQNRIIVKLDKVAKIMQRAQVAIEDNRFYEHGPLDLRGTFRAFFNNASGNSTQGGSSITQQYVKMTLQEEALQRGDQSAANDAIKVSYARKLREIRLAMHVEETMTKKQILTGYMNLAYYGDKAYGIEAAALHYFDVHASELNLSQAATLAGVVQSPGNSDPHNYPEVAERRRNVVLDRMQSLGIITAAQAKEAKKPSVKSMLRIRNNSGGKCDQSSQPYFCNYVMDYLATLPQLGANKTERLLAVNRGGLRIQTTLRSDWQGTIFQDLTSKVPTGDPSGIGAAAAVIEPGTGKVLAMVQTSEYGQTKDKKSSTARTTQSWVVPQQYGGTLGFPIGSTAKVFTLLTALEHGIPVNGVVPAPKAGPGVGNGYIFEPNVYKDACSSPKPWNVNNDSFISGPTLPFRQATAYSVNTAFAATMISLGGCEVAKMWKRLGAVDGAGNQVFPGPSNLVLGSGSMPPLTLANVYATLASGGIWCPPTPIASITTSTGKKIKLPAAKCKRVLDPKIVAGADELLQGVINMPGGTGNAAGIGRPAAGKTGTHEGHQQSWFVGYTPQLATAVYVGTPITAHRMDGYGACVGGTCYGQIFGGTIAAPLWGRIMSTLTAGMPVESFPAVESQILYGNQVAVPYVVGMTVDGAKAALAAAGFNAVLGGTTNSTITAGLVAQASPAGVAPKGTTITLLTSTGYVPPPPVVHTPPPTSTTSPGTTTTKPPSGTTSTKPPTGGTGTGTGTSNPTTLTTPPPSNRAG